MGLTEIYIIGPTSGEKVLLAFVSEGKWFCNSCPTDDPFENRGDIVTHIQFEHILYR